MNRSVKDDITSTLTRIERSFSIPPPTVTVLAYHSISNDHTIVDIHPDEFKKHINILRTFCTCISLDEVLSIIREGKQYDKPVVALTFDDGYKDLVPNVLPILTKYSIPASVFVLSEPLSANRQELANKKPLMNTEEVLLLKKYGWTIGCHSATHPYFGNPDINMQKEIVDSKKHLEEGLGFEMKYFVYPKGVYTNAIMTAVEKAKYSGAFAFEPGIISGNTNRFAIPRMPVDWTHSEKQFEAFFTQWGLGYLRMRHAFINHFSKQ